MKLSSIRKLLSIVLTLALLVNLIPNSNAAIANIKAGLTLTKSLSSHEVLKNHEFTINYNITPHPIHSSLIPKNGSQDSKEVVLVIDVSGSMNYGLNGSYYDKPDRLSIVKESAVNFVNQLKEYTKNTKVSLLTYSGKANFLYQNGTEWFDISNLEQYDLLINNIKGINAVGGTNIGDALRKGYNLLNQSSADIKKFFVFMTDGVPTGYSYYNPNISSSEQAFFTQNGEAPNIVEGNSDPKGLCLEYAKLMGQELNKINNISNYFIAFASNDAGNKLSEVSSVVNNSIYKSATSAVDLADIYSQIADKVVNSFSLTNVYFQDAISWDGSFEVVNTSSNLNFDDAKNGRAMNLESIHYSLQGDYYVANPIQFSVTVKAKKEGTYSLGNKSSSYIRYDDIDGTEARINIEQSIITVKDYNPLVDADLRPNQVKIDTNNNEVCIDVNWTDNDQGVEYFLLGDQTNTGDNSGDKFFTINPHTGIINVRNMKKLREELLSKGSETIVAQKFISVQTGNNYEYLDGSSEAIITRDDYNQVGFFQTNTPLDLTKRAEINFELYLGSNQGSYGADGVVLVINDKTFSPGKDSVSSGGGLGYDKDGNKGMQNLLSNSVGFEFDTWINHRNQFSSVTQLHQQDLFSQGRYNDDHITVVENGSIAHINSNVIYKQEGNMTPNNAGFNYLNHYDYAEYSNNYAAPSQYTVAELEDGKWRKGQLIWDPVSNTSSLSFDVNGDSVIQDNERDLVIYTTDLEQKFPSKQAYFGFTGATGASKNHQAVRSITVKQGSTANINGSLIVKAVKGEDVYYKGFEVEIFRSAKAIDSVTRTISNPINVTETFNVTYSFQGESIMPEAVTNADTLYFNSITFKEQLPPYMEVVNVPAGIYVTGTIETGFILEGSPNITLRKDNSTGLYNVNGTLSIQLRPTDVYTTSLDKGTILYEDPNGVRGDITLDPTTIDVRDKIVPEIYYVGSTIDNNTNKIKAWILLNGTYTEAQEIRYRYSSVISPNLLNPDVFKVELGLSTNLTSNMTKNPTYVKDSSEYAKHKNKPDYSFAEMNLDGNGYYYIFIKDEHGNEKVYQWEFRNVENFSPTLT